jgi:hypothetical protein
LTINQDVVTGQNTLTFKALDSDILISNLEFIRYTLAENIIYNSKFTEAAVGAKIPGLQSSAKIVNSDDYADG